MGLFDRTAEALEREVNRLLDDLEDPEESLRYTDERLRDELARVDEALVDLVARRKRLERERDRLEERIDTHNDRARAAVADYEDDRAREHLEEKRADLGRLDDVETRIADLRDAETDLKARRNELRTRIDRFRTERAELNARQRAASAERSASDALGGEGEEGGYADRRVADATDRVEESEARAAAVEELRSEGFFEDTPAGRTDAARVDAEVESELETLRRRYREDDADGPDAPDHTGAPDSTDHSDGSDDDDH